MSYSVKLQGKSYTLPTKTMAIMKQLERFAELPQLYESRAITIEQVLREQFDFLAQSIGEEAALELAGGDIEAADVDTIAFAVIDIVEAYTRDAARKQIQAQTSQLKALMADKDVAKAVDAVSKAG